MKGAGQQRLMYVGVEMSEGLWTPEFTPLPDIFRHHPEKLVQFGWVSDATSNK